MEKYWKFKPDRIANLGTITDPFILAISANCIREYDGKHSYSTIEISVSGRYSVISLHLK